MRPPTRSRSRCAAGCALHTRAETAQELANDIEAVDSVFHYDADEQRVILDAKPWKDDPHHFKRVRVSAVALIKMVRRRLNSDTQASIELEVPLSHR